MEPILSVEHVQKIYGGRGSHTKALEDVSFAVERGEFIGLMGASGSGKSTLLNCVSTIDAPTSGRIAVEGRAVTALRGRALAAFRRERLGFIFQDCNLLDTLTAFENIALALTITGTPAGEVEGRVSAAGARLGLEGVLHRYPYQLSGGECQRVAAARAIITRPALILADEPTGALDSKSAQRLLEQLDGLNREEGATILVVTHDAFTASWCHRILLLRDGRLWGQLERQGQDRRPFFGRILEAVGRLGGEAGDDAF